MLNTISRKKLGKFCITQIYFMAWQFYCGETRTAIVSVSESQLSSYK